MFKYLLLSAVSFFAVCEGSQWPIPYKTVDRPEVEPECRPLSRDFCKDGLPYGDFPIWWADDTISLFALMKTQTELKNTAMEQKMTSYTLGLRSNNTGKRYTLSWEPLSKLNDTIAPRILPDRRVVWCNQAAFCLREDRHHFSHYTSFPIGNVSGEFIDVFEVWVKHVNNTMPFQQEFLIYSGNQIFLSSFDSTVLFIRAIKTMKNIGAKFSTNDLEMQAYVVVGHPPTRLGTKEAIRESNPDLWREIMTFYGYLQVATSLRDFEDKRIKLFIEMHFHKRFYYFFNGEYWFVKVKRPFKAIHDFLFKLA